MTTKLDFIFRVYTPKKFGNLWTKPRNPLSFNTAYFLVCISKKILGKYGLNWVKGLNEVSPVLSHQGASVPS